MIDTMQANSFRKPNFDFNQKNRKFVLDLKGNSVADMAEILWAGDIASTSGGSKRANTAIPYSPLIVKNTNWSGKVKKIKELVNRGRYKIDPAKLAEKMLGEMVGILMAS